MSNGLHWFDDDATPTVDFMSLVIPDGAPEALTAAAPACSLETYISELDATSNAVAATLADGYVHGQVKRVIASVVSGGAVTLTIASAVSASLNVVTFTVIGDTADLIWNQEEGYWRIYQLLDTDRDVDTPTVA